MCAIIPIVLGVSLNAEILPQIEAALHDRIDIFLEIRIIVHWLVKQEQQVPVAVFTGIATGTRAIKI